MPQKIKFIDISKERIW